MTLLLEGQDTVSAGTRINEIFSLPIRKGLAEPNSFLKKRANQIYDDMEKDLGWMH